MEYTFFYPAPVSDMYYTIENHALTGLWFERQKYAPSPKTGTVKKDTAENSIAKTVPPETGRIAEQVRRWLDLYFAGKDPGFLPPLAPKGTPFREDVWKLLLTIPYGQTMSYGEIASKIAALQGKKKMSAQAVGGAVGHNPIAIIIPCHRVIGTDGSLTGYAAGLPLKEALLKLENIPF